MNIKKVVKPGSYEWQARNHEAKVGECNHQVPRIADKIQLRARSLDSESDSIWLSRISSSLMNRT